MFGLDQTDLAVRLPRLSERPFDSDRKRMTTMHRLAGGGVRIACKGAPESVLTPGVLVNDAGRPGASIGGKPEQGLDLLGLLALRDPLRPAAAAPRSRARPPIWS